MFGQVTLWIKWLIFDWIINDTEQYFDLHKIELLGKELFDHLTVCKQMIDA